MKKLIFMFLAILLCGIVQAQTSEIILNNGKVVKALIPQHYSLTLFISA